MLRDKKFDFNSKFNIKLSVHFITLMQFLSLSLKLRFDDKINVAKPDKSYSRQTR